MGTDPVGTGGGGFGGGPASGESACGLYLDSYYYPFGPGCVVKGQLNPPRETGLEVCPYRLAPGPVYNGAKLKGCCRSDGLCGYFDDITGLGCLDTYIFDGVSSTQYCF